VSAIAAVFGLFVAIGVIVTARGHDAKRVTAVTTAAATPTTDAVGEPTQSPPDLTTFNGVLTAQEAALLRGDERGWLAPVDPKAPAAIAEAKRIFHNMRAMHVTAWDQSSIGGFNPVTATKQTYEIDVSYCLAVPSCNNTQATLVATVQLHGGKVLIESLTAPKANTHTNDPLPWEVATLSAVVGPRVIVAASSAESSRLKSALSAAEGAAANADKFAMWGKPEVYVVYLADHSESRQWFHADASSDLGMAITMTASDIQVLMVLPDAAEVRDAGPGGFPSVLRHEFGHVATLTGISSNDDDSLVEGVAEYISFAGHPSWAQDDNYAARVYIRSGKWSKKIYLTKEIFSKNLITANAAYGIGYLGLRYLANAYGQHAMLAFWGDVEHQGISLNGASETEFHKPWTSVNAGAVAYVKKTLHI